ncbi:MAG: hypothetical protein EZS28_006923 [Streblomastix strix]|uniref:Uncharacterized protein n=1 Tax=Streblomastix strix TaxID=222440 RepID=A0A5J4WR36_9EUKA|nr:MAG: hypothetical protein EZS28_006923 [Streblomastix strix]
MQGVEDEPSEEDEDYITKVEVANQYVGIWGNQQIIGTKSFQDKVTANGFVKSGGTNQQVLLANGTTKPLSEFTTTIEDSNYIKKDSDVQDIQGILRKTTLDQPYPEPTDDDYITLGAVKSEFVSSVYSGSISGNLTATSFIKSGKDDTSVLLADGGDALLSSLGALELVTIAYTNNTVSPNSIMSLKCYIYGLLVNFYGYIYMDNGAGASGASVAVCTLENAGFPKYLFYADDIAFAGSAFHVANFRFGTDGKVTITIKALTGTAGLAGAASACINVTYPAAN